MKHNITFFCAALLLSSFSLACSDDSEDNPTDSNDSMGGATSEADNKESDVAAADAKAADADESTAETQSETESSTAIESDTDVEVDSNADTETDDEELISMGPDISIATTDEGEALVNAAGFTLYYFAADTTDEEAKGVSGTWPAVKIESPSLGEGLDAANFGVTSNGSTTYKGLPLYTYAADAEPGDANGVSSSWPLATP